MAKKPIVSVSYENERISIKNSLPYLKCALRLSCGVHGPIYGRLWVFMLTVFSLYKGLLGARKVSRERSEKRVVFLLAIVMNTNLVSLRNLQNPV